MDIEKCQELCREYNLKLIEDCAHCCPAYYTDSNGKKQMVGSSADIACFSFYANKTITTGEGGMALTDDEELADRMRVMSLHGISKDAWKRFSREGSWYYEIVAPGFKYNMPDTAAAIGVNQLKKADAFFQERKIIAEKYSQALSDIEGIILPVEREGNESSWHLYVIRIDQEICGIRRNDLIDRLSDAEIGTSVHYTPLHMHPYYVERFGYLPDDFPVAKRLYEGMISLPIYPGLSDDDIDRISALLHKLC